MIILIFRKYYENPFKALKDLNDLYNKHNKFKSRAIKNQISYTKKKEYKKIIEEEKNKDELDTVPKNQKVFRRRDIRKLNIMYG